MRAFITCCELLTSVLTSLKCYIYYTTGIPRIQRYPAKSANEFLRNPQTKITTVNAVVIGILF